PVEKRAFPDGEVCPRIVGDVDNHAIVAERLSLPLDPNRYLIETLFITRNLRALGVEKIDVVMPYFIYSRQDKVFRKGEPHSAKYVLELLEKAGATRFFTVSSHVNRNDEKISLTPMPAYNINGFESIGNQLKKFDLHNPVVVGADLGVSHSTETIANILGAESFAFQKKRDLNTGEIIVKGNLNVEGRDIVIVDDIISSGRTMLNSIEICNSSGADRILCTAVHPALATGVFEKISSKVWKFIATDTISSPISEISVTESIAEKIKSSAA
ncbi:MAG: ribose-phosphate diphosphokinase, partial [Candidatus Aenigmatarchaeota archaeon]